MKLIDLTIPLGIGTPAWPTYEPLQVKYFKRLAPNGANGQLADPFEPCRHAPRRRNPLLHARQRHRQPELDFLVGPGAVVDLSDAAATTTSTHRRCSRSGPRCATATSLLSTPATTTSAGTCPPPTKSATWSSIPGQTANSPSGPSASIRWIGVDCGSADHPMNTMIRQWMPRRPSRPTRTSGRSTAGLEEHFDDSKYQLMHIEMFPHHIIHAECIGGELDLLSTGARP